MTFRSEYRLNTPTKSEENAEKIHDERKQLASLFHLNKTILIAPNERFAIRVERNHYGSTIYDAGEFTDT